MAIVEFDVDEFREMYCGLTDAVISDECLENLFDVAVEMIGNSDEVSFYRYEPDAIPPVKTRKIMLYLVVCHLATLQINTPNGIAGRVSSATEGSVSATYDLIKTNSQSAQWWNQTQCGARYWIMSAKYRLGGRLIKKSNYHPWG